MIRMPKHLLFVCILYIATRTIMALIAPFHETGIARITSPALMFLFIATAVFFMRRATWAWPTMQMIAVVEIAINAAFFPTVEFYGPLTGLAKSVIGVLMLACLAIICSIRWSYQTKAWFSDSSASG